MRKRKQAIQRITEPREPPEYLCRFRISIQELDKHGNDMGGIFTCYAREFDVTFADPPEPNAESQEL